MAGYIRQDTTNNIADGNVVNASDFDDEYNAIEAAFHASTGHTHDGTSAEGAPITKVGPAQDLVVGIAAITPKTDNTLDLGSSLLEFKDLYIDGTANIDSLVADTADINAGTIDGTTIGGSVAAAGTFTTATATTGNITTVNATTVDTTNLEASNIKAKDGTASATIANSTGVMTIASSVLTTADINGGTMDNVTIGGSTPAAGNFTNLDATGTLAVDGNVTLGNAATDTVTVNGYMGVGGAANAAIAALVQSNALSGASQEGVRSSITSTSGATTAVRGFYARPTTAAAVFTATDLSGFYAANPTKGAGSTITNQHGVYIEDQTQGTNNYGITSLVSSGSNKWNIYASGTAANYFAGDVGIGTATLSGGISVVKGAAGSEVARFQNAGSFGIRIIPQIGGSGSVTAIRTGVGESITLDTANTERMRIDSSGNVGIGITPGAWNASWKALQVNGLSLWGANTGLTQHFSSNAIFDSGGYKYIATGFATDHYTDSGSYYWRTAPSGLAGGTVTFTERFKISETEAVFNDPGNDYDFRVESDTNTHALFVDAGNSRVGINNSSPSVALDITGDLKTSGNTTLGDASTDTVTVNGYMGVGGAANSAVGIIATPSALSGATQYGIFSAPTATSAATSGVSGLYAKASTAAASFTTASLRGIYVADSTKGAGSTITDQHGILIVDQTAGTNNYGITSLVSSGSNKWNIYASGTAQNYFAGNVGIGTSSPTDKLQVIGDVLIGTDSGSAFNGNADLKLQNTGNVYIQIKAGTASETGLLFGDTDDSFVGGVRYSNATDTLLFNAGNVERISVSATEFAFNDVGADTDFRVESDTNTHALFVQGSDGNVGIGTSSPATNLHVQQTGAVGGNYGIRVSQPSYTSNYGELTLDTTNSVVKIASSATYPLAAYTNGSERLRIDSSGNLGLGVTPSAWGSSYKAMQIAGGASLMGTSNGAWLAGNCYFDNTNWRYVTTNSATMLNMAANGTFNFFTAPSGTAGNALTFTERASISTTEFVVNNPGEDYDFRVESDTNTHMLFVDAGNNRVGIGTSAPVHKLEVQGDDVGAGSGETVVRITQPATTVSARSELRSGVTNGTNPYLAFAVRSASSPFDVLERLRITSAGNVSIGGTADRATTVGTAALNIFNGTAPVGTLTNGISIYSSSGEAYVMDAAGNATLFSPHDAETNEWIFKSKHTPTGKVLRIDVEKLLRFVNDHFGLDAVQEFIEP